jgi:hypothetical protein
MPRAVPRPSPGDVAHEEEVGEAELALQIGLVAHLFSLLVPALGAGLADPAVGYSVVYHIEIALLFATLAAIGPLVRVGHVRTAGTTKFGLAEMPG